MADVRGVSIVVLKRQGSAIADIQVVRKPVPFREFFVADAILVELRILNHNVASGNVALQESILIVVEVAVEYRKIDPTRAYAGAVRAIGIANSGIFANSMFSTVVLLPVNTQIPCLSAICPVFDVSVSPAALRTGQGAVGV